MNNQQATSGQGPAIDINQTIGLSCDKCGNETFIPAFFLRKVSKFVSPNGQEQVAPLDTMQCAKCGHVNKEFNPLYKFGLIEDKKEKNN